MIVEDQDLSEDTWWGRDQGLWLRLTGICNGLGAGCNTNAILAIYPLSHMNFPRAHWLQMHNTNTPERLNAEIKRRTHVVGVFPKTRPTPGWSAQCST